MTLVTITLTTPLPDGTLQPVTGWLQWTPTRGRVSNTPVVSDVLPLGFQIDLFGKAVTAQVAPTAQDWVWMVTYHLSGNMPVTAYYAVPDVDTIDFTALSQVDPATLAPSATPDPAWYAYAENVVAAVSPSAALDGGDAASLYTGTFNLDGGAA